MLLAAWLGALFLLGNWFPLRATDLWCHAEYGHWILDRHALPERDPFFPLASVTPLFDYAWLSQVLLALVERAGGVEWISNVFALTLLASQLLLARAFFLQSQSAAVALLGSVVAVIAGWSRIATVRPETFAALAFAVLLWLIVSSWNEKGRAGIRSKPEDGGLPWRLWVGAPLLMALWANLHGSFVCGLAVLGCFFLGQVVEAAWDARSLLAPLRDRGCRQWLGLCVAATIATAVNPYGLGLLRFAFGFAGNPNLADIQEWRPLVILGPGGREFALSWVLLLVVLRHSRRRVPAAHVLLLAVFGIAAVTGVRMLGWYAAVYGVVLVPHLADVWGRLFPTKLAGESAPGAALADGVADQADPAPTAPNEAVLPPGRSFWHSLVCLLLVWIAFALAPISSGVLGREPREPERLYGPSTPWAATQHLLAHPRAGMAFCPAWWGDWLRREGPQGLQPMVGTNIHLVPPGVWRDYQHVASGLTGWQQALDRYGVETLILERETQPVLCAAAGHSPRWQTVYEDAQAMVLIRRSDPQPAKKGLQNNKLGSLIGPKEAQRPWVQ